MRHEGVSVEQTLRLRHAVDAQTERQLVVVHAQVLNAVLRPRAVLAYIAAKPHGFTSLNRGGS